MPSVNYQVPSGADDCVWSSSSFSNSFTTVYIGRTTSALYSSSLRFTGVTIPDGVSISSAYISFYFLGYYGSPPACTLSFEDAANPGEMGGLDDAKGRTLTTNNISITGPTSGTWWNSGSIIDIIEELRTSYSYASGAAMQCIIVGSGTESNYSRQYSYDSDPALAAILHIEWPSLEIEEFTANTAVLKTLSATAAATNILSAAGVITHTLDEDAAATITSSKSTAITTAFASDDTVI